MSNPDNKNLIVGCAVAGIIAGIAILYQQDKLPNEVKSSIDRVAETLRIKEKDLASKAQDAANKASADLKAAANDVKAAVDKELNK